MPFTSAFAFPYLASTDAPDIPQLGKGLAEAVEAEIQRVDVDAADIAAFGNSKVLNVGGAVDSTTSATYVNLAAPSSLAFTKLRPAVETSLRIELHLNWFTNPGDVTVWFGVLVGGVDRDVDTAGTSLAAGVGLKAGGVVLATGLAAGAHTIQARWKRTAGTGVPSRIALNRLSLSCTEVAA